MQIHRPANRTENIAMATRIPIIKITDVDGPQKWDPTHHFCYDNLIRTSRPYQRIYHFVDNGASCLRFLDQGQRARAVLVVDTLSRKDIREINEQDRRQFLRHVLCSSHSEGRYLAKELRRTKDAVETAIVQKYGPYEKDWKSLRDTCFSIMETPITNTLGLLDRTVSPPSIRGPGNGIPLASPQRRCPRSRRRSREEILQADDVGGNWGRELFTEVDVCDELLGGGEKEVETVPGDLRRAKEDCCEGWVLRAGG